MKKYCPDCNLYLEAEAFRKSKKGRDGLSRICLKCEVHQVRTVSIDDKPNRKMRRREMKIRRFGAHALKYGLSEKEWIEMLEVQKNLCAICRTKQPGKVLCIDHDHKTGAVRGLLCGNCNVGLGNFKDNTKILKSAISYLMRGMDSGTD